MATKAYKALLEQGGFVVCSSTNPWGSSGWIPEDVVLGKVIQCKVGVGAEVGSATIELTNRSFGNILPSMFYPISIKHISDKNKLKTIWRGFIVTEDGELTASTDKMVVNASDYKWYISKITTIRGRIYTTNGTLPEKLSTSLAVINVKLEYEKFRFIIEDNAGYLQNEGCVFNKDGIPDCNPTSCFGPAHIIFYVGTISRDETGGTTANTWKGDKWKGKFWTFDKVLQHIVYYWIKPYIGGMYFKIANSSLSAMKALGVNNTVPYNFSIEGQNPLAAIDNVVASLPGRWIWWLEYSNPPYIYLMIKNIGTGSSSKSLIIGDNEKIVNAKPIPNVASVVVKRDATKMVRYAIARGGAIKLVTTIKLVPLWPKFSGKDFENAADYNAWQNWNNTKSKTTEVNAEELSADQKARFPLIYRQYGIARKGQTFSEQMADAVDSIELSGSIGAEYSAYSKELKEMFFKNIKTARVIEPPLFDKYSDKIQVFLRDDLLDCDAPKETKAAKTATGTVPTVIKADYKWLSSEHDDDLKYTVDANTGIVTFTDPQFMRKMNIYAVKPKGKEISYPAVFTDAKTRIVYMTATFVTDVASIIGRKRVKNFWGGMQFPHFSEYKNDAGASIVIHANAWYPINYNLKTETVITDSTETLDGVPIGTVIRKCTSFGNYKKYVGNGAQQLLMAVVACLSSNSDPTITATAELGVVDISFLLGDRIKEIKNSSSNGSAGYYGLRCYINGVNHKVIGDSRKYSTSIEFTNAFDKRTEFGTNISNVSRARKDIYHPLSETDLEEVAEQKLPKWSDIEDML